MSIHLLRVELANIRSHEHVVFEPKSDGITAISGPIGSGKSTIVDSIAWGLYGTKPDGVSKNNEIYRSDGDFKKDKAFVRITFQIDGRVSEVERRIMTKSGSVECDIWHYLTKEEAVKATKKLEESESNKDDSEKDVAEERFSHEVPEYIYDLVDNADNLVRIKAAGSSPSSAGKEIRRVMGMDEKGFLAAILVQQKQVDTLISPRTKERAKIIEDLTGISSITTALGESRNESNALKKMASMSDASEENLKEAQKNLDTLIKEKDSSNKTRKKLQEKLAKTKTTYNELKKEFNEKNAIFDKTEEIQNKLSKIEAKLEVSEKNFEFELKEKDEKKKQLSKLPPTGDFSEIESQMDAITAQLHNTQNKLDNTITEISELTKENETSLEFISKSKVKTAVDCNDNRTKVITQIEKLELMMEKAKKAKIVQNSEIAKIDRAINVLTEGDGTCPTCLQHVSAVEVAVQSLEAQKNDSIVKIEEIDSKNKTIRTKIETSEKTIEKYDELLTYLIVVEEYEDKLKELTQQKTKLTSSISDINTEFKAIQKVYRNAKQASDLKQEYQRLLDKAKETSDEIERLKKFQENGKEKLKEVGSVTQIQLSKVRSKYQESSEKFNNESEQFSESDTLYQVLKEKVFHAEHLVTEEKEKLEQHKKVLQLVEVANYTTKTIEEFRENRIKQAVPTIEAYASDFINKFTEGRFTMMKMNEKFDTKVVLADGTERSVGLLSGGELSAAAMALRLAISLLIGGDSSKNLIILDEVLVSQDANSAEIILSTIKEVCKGQVIIIAHNASIESVVDKTVLLGQDEKM